MDKRILEALLIDQKERLENRCRFAYCERDAEPLIDLATDTPQLLMGVRGGGKTVMARHRLMEAGACWGFISFDDDRVASLTPADADDILEVLYKIYGSIDYILVDEIQNVDSWLEMAEAMMGRGVRLIITGSNANRLSPLPESWHVIPVYPLSFVEYCVYNKVDVADRSPRGVAALRSAFDLYLIAGGFPAVLNNQRPRRYLNDLVTGILHNDLEKRLRIINKAEFERMARHVIASAPVAVKFSHYAEAFDVKSEHSIKKYLSILKDSYLLEGLHKFALRDKQRIIGEKIYTVDPSLIGADSNTADTETNRRLETVVYIHLLRHFQREGFRIHYLADRTVECNFVICRDMKMRHAIQVAYDITDDRALRRKVAGLVSMARLTGCTSLTLLTDNQSRDITSGEFTVAVRPAYSFLLSAEIPRPGEL